MGSVGVMQMLYGCVHPVAVLNAVFCMTCTLLMLVEDGRGILHSLSHDCKVVGSHACLLLFIPILLR